MLLSEEREFQAARAQDLRERWLTDLLFGLGTGRGLSLLDLKERKDSQVVRWGRRVRRKTAVKVAFRRV